jgi:hypothetical protein
MVVWEAPIIAGTEEQAAMSDADYLRVKKDLIWNVGLYTVIAFMLAIECFLAYLALNSKLAPIDSIKIMSLRQAYRVLF